MRHFFENFSQLNAPTISEPDIVGALSQCNITKLFKKNLKYPQISQLLYQQAKRPRVQATKTIPYKANLHGLVIPPVNYFGSKSKLEKVIA